MLQSLVSHQADHSINTVVSSPRISHDALAGVGAGDVGELALERRGRGPAVDPFHFGGGGGQRGVVRLRRAVDDEARAGQRLEGGAR